MGGRSPASLATAKTPDSLGNKALSSAWISANAGSGKTHALVSRAVKLLLLGVPAERICCITYTRAAAAEMRNRVIETLRDLLLADEQSCAKKVSEVLGRAATAEELARAKSLFGQMLDSTTGGMSLTTIHGFCQRLLRAFPLEAGVVPYFSVLDETETAHLISRAGQRLLDDDDDKELAEALADFAERAPEQKFLSLAKTILQSRAQWRTIWNAQPPELFKQRLYALHGLTPDGSEQALVEDYCHVISEQDAALIRRELPRLKGDMAERLAAWLSADSAARISRIPDMVNIWLTKEFTPRAKLVSEKDFPAGSPLRALFTRITEASLTFVAECGALACAEESYGLALIARALMDHYAQLKTDRCAMDYDDLIVHTAELLTTREMTAWVMTKLDHRIDHLLIDEAQDTSTGQWQIAEALVSELVASSQGVGSAGMPRSLLVVGDEKQSIFSFQGAAPELFAHKQSIFTELLSHSAAPLVPDKLVHSRRSAPAILNFVDTVAALPDITPSLSAMAQVEKHEAFRAKTAGEVTLYPLVEGEDKEKLPALTIPLEYQITKGAAQTLADTIAEQIAQWLKQERMLANEGRRLTAGDILILVWRREPMVPALIRALTRRNIPVAGIDRLVLAEHLAVRDILALIRWLGFTGDDLALAQVLRSPLVGLSEEDLFALAHDRGEASLWERVRATGHAASLLRWLECKDITPYEFLTDVLETSDARRRFAERFGEEVHEVLDELKEQSLRLPLAPNLANFAMFLESAAHSVKREQEAKITDQVRIMTVHGAKGLEAPVVMLADTTRIPGLQHEQVYTQKDKAGQLFPLVALTEKAKLAPVITNAKAERKSALHREYHRLLYVALTRARDELHLFGMGKAAEDSWYGILQRAIGRLPATNENGMLRYADAPVTGVTKKTSPLRETSSLPEWVKPVQKSAARVATLAPSRLAVEVSTPFARYQPQEAKERGVRIHRVLQCLNATTTEADVGQLLRIVAPDWEAKTRAAAGQEIWALYQREHWLWEHEADAEVSIGGDIEIHGTMVPVNGQIDRLIRTKEAIVILDYKTGRTVPETATDVPLNYILQLKTYDALLRRIEPGATIKSAILWTSQPKFMDISALVGATPWQENHSFPHVSGDKPFAA